MTCQEQNLYTMPGCAVRQEDEKPGASQSKFLLEGAASAILTIPYAYRIMRLYAYGIWAPAVLEGLCAFPAADWYFLSSAKTRFAMHKPRQGGRLPS